MVDNDAGDDDYDNLSLTTCGFGGLVGLLVGSEVGLGVGGFGLSPPVYLFGVLSSFDGGIG